MPDFLYDWSMWCLNWWHVHPIIWWSVIAVYCAIKFAEGWLHV